MLILAICISSLATYNKNKLDREEICLISFDIKPQMIWYKFYFNKTDTRVSNSLHAHRERLAPWTDLLLDTLKHDALTQL